MGSPGRALRRSFYAGDVLEIAPRLLNKVLVRGQVAARIVEVEAYRGEEDPASHAFRGPTPRNATMFGGPGRLYVYFTYGMHWCANVVCAPAGSAEAVLLRAAAPLRGVDAMRARRPKSRRDVDLANGPAKLCEAFAITGMDDGADLVTGDRGIRILDDGIPPPTAPGVSGRVGIRVAERVPWRFFVPGDHHVSRGPHLQVHW
ncbi:MAG TPA: DNA-3-methyladenine glycosylase [Acidimicrobiales bacterium]|nr:DNA-3-methyladenine glycosylase [Acidimicrobiales bacterium]